MIQELLGVLAEERKISIPPTLSPINGGSATSSPITPTMTSSSSSSPAATSAPSEPPLRCPRCDSSNTKFCYYNNYNLTQPRHFCKTCRRYWTKGGALRNVPIGGGCRKAKPAAAVAAAKSAVNINKPNKPFSSPNTELASSPVVWASSSHASHLLALLRGNTSITNPNPNAGLISKLDSTVLGSPLMAGENSSVTTMNTQSLSLDPLGQIAINGPMMWRNNNNNNNNSSLYYHNQPQIQSSFLAINGRNTDPLQALTGNVCSSALPLSSSSSFYSTATSRSAPAPPITLAGTTTAAMEQISVLSGGNQLGNYWNNNALSWTDLPTANGALL